MSRRSRQTYDREIAGEAWDYHVTQARLRMLDPQADIDRIALHNGWMYDFYWYRAMIDMWLAGVIQPQWYLDVARRQATQFMKVTTVSSGSPNTAPDGFQDWPHVYFIGQIRWAIQTARLCSDINHSSTTSIEEKAWATATRIWLRRNITDKWAAKFFSVSTTQAHQCRGTADSPPTRFWLDQIFLSMSYAMWMIANGDTNNTVDEVQDLFDLWTGRVEPVGNQVRTISGSPDRLEWDRDNPHFRDDEIIPDTSHAGAFAQCVLIAHELGDYLFPPNFMQNMANTFSHYIYREGESYEGSNHVFSNFIDGTNETYDPSGRNFGPYENGRIYVQWSEFARGDARMLAVLKEVHRENEAGLGYINGNRSHWGRSSIPATILYAQTNPLTWGEPCHRQ